MNSLPNGVVWLIATQSLESFRNMLHIPKFARLYFRNKSENRKLAMKKIFTFYDSNKIDKLDIDMKLIDNEGYTIRFLAQDGEPIVEQDYLDGVVKIFAKKSYYFFGDPFGEYCYKRSDYQLKFGYDEECCEKIGRDLEYFYDLFILHETEMTQKIITFCEKVLEKI
jgi:hypothetical protein